MRPSVGDSWLMRLRAGATFMNPAGLLFAAQTICNALDACLEFRLVLHEATVISLEEVLRSWNEWLRLGSVNESLRV